MPDPNQDDTNQNTTPPTITDIPSGDQPVVIPSDSSTLPPIAPLPPIEPPVISPPVVPSSEYIPPTEQVTPVPTATEQVPSFLNSTDLPPLAPDFQNVAGDTSATKKEEEKV